MAALPKHTGEDVYYATRLDEVKFQVTVAIETTTSGYHVTTLHLKFHMYNDLLQVSGFH